ncbi:hypothetical protein LCGC14_3033360 [marine sediment metagenome]|uniref:Uncharacterized protein n=1 Tax=marine sediment metagenome TaxID=412755 RepID=A0A0F8WRI9_9ZZZZ
MKDSLFCTRSKEHLGAMDNQLFRVMLSWFMVSDPWPLGDTAHRVIEDLLNKESKRRKYVSWIYAFHKYRDI